MREKRLQKHYLQKVIMGKFIFIISIVCDNKAADFLEVRMLRSSEQFKQDTLCGTHIDTTTAEASQCNRSFIRAVYSQILILIMIYFAVGEQYITAD